MKNITISVDEEVLKRARAYAGRHHTTLNQLIRDLLDRTVSTEAGAGEMAEFVLLAGESGGDSGGRRWKREDLYDV
jgi:plasmid stability protein